MTERGIKARLRDWHDELLALSRFGRSTCEVHQPRNPTCAFCTMERLRDALAAIEALEAERDEARANCDLLHGLKFSERNHRAILARAEGAEAEVRALRAQAAAPAEETGQARHCTCHPDDHPPQPCAKRYAYSECVASVGPPAAEPTPVTWDDEQPDPCHERVMALATELGELKAENKRLRFGPPAAEGARPDPMSRNVAERCAAYEAELQSTPSARLDEIARLVADDAWAITFQTMGQYRTAILEYLSDVRALDAAWGEE